MFIKFLYSRVPVIWSLLICRLLGWNSRKYSALSHKDAITVFFKPVPVGHTGCHSGRTGEHNLLQFIKTTIKCTIVSIHWWKQVKSGLSTLNQQEELFKIETVQYFGFGGGIQTEEQILLLRLKWDPKNSKYLTILLYILKNRRKVDKNSIKLIIINKYIKIKFWNDEFYVYGGFQ